MINNRVYYGGNNGNDGRAAINQNYVHVFHFNSQHRVENQLIVLEYFACYVVVW